jgi:hypothetical protein
MMRNGNPFHCHLKRFKQSQTAESAATPVPAALPLFVTGLGALGLLGWHRKRKAQGVA